MTLRSFLLAAFLVISAGTALSLVTGVPARAGSCAATTVSNVAFGSPNMLPATAVDTTTTVNISCAGMPAGQWVTCLSLDAGSAGISGSNRLMTSGGATMTYNLYQDAARTIPWGSRTNASLGTVPDMPLPAGANVSTTVTIYGRVIAGQSTVSPGSYSSTFSGSTQTNFFVLKKSVAGCMTGSIDGAQTGATPSFTVSATPGANCNLSTSPLAFGSQGSLSANVDATTTVSVQCTNTSPYNVGLDPGQAAGATVTTRKMTSGSTTVSYSLYRDASRTQNWGQTIGADTLSGAGTGASQSITVYGRVPTQTTPAVGTYNDAVVATVTY